MTAVLVPLTAAALIMSIGTHALLLWTRRQQLVHAIRRRPTDSPFGDDPTCFIEGVSLRALAATLALDAALDVATPLAALHCLALPLFDAAQLPPLLATVSLWSLLLRVAAVAVLCAPVALISMLLSRAIHLAPRSASVLLAMRRARVANVARLAILLATRDAIALVALVLVLAQLAPSLRPTPFACAAPLALGAICGAVCSHPFDSLALAAATADPQLPHWRHLWLGVAPRAARLAMITVCVPFWFTLVSVAMAAAAAAAR
jgi:hypothetical protein